MIRKESKQSYILTGQKSGYDPGPGYEPNGKWNKPQAKIPSSSMHNKREWSSVISCSLAALIFLGEANLIKFYTGLLYQNYTQSEPTTMSN